MPTVTTVERLDDGPLRVGSRARLKQPGQRPTVWAVTAHEPEQRFEWEASVFGVRTVASHLIEPTADGARNTLRLELTGRGAGVMGRLIGRTLRTVLSTENDCFRRAAEARPADATP
jgi:hypothetical protein